MPCRHTLRVSWVTVDALSLMRADKVMWQLSSHDQTMLGVNNLTTSLNLLTLNFVIQSTTPHANMWGQDCVRKQITVCVPAKHLYWVRRLEREPQTRAHTLTLFHSSETTVWGHQHCELTHTNTHTHGLSPATEGKAPIIMNITLNIWAVWQYVVLVPIQPLLLVL